MKLLIIDFPAVSCYCPKRLLSTLFSNTLKAVFLNHVKHTKREKYDMGVPHESNKLLPKLQLVYQILATFSLEFTIGILCTLFNIKHKMFLNNIQIKI
jgi:hypothetical protein